MNFIKMHGAGNDYIFVDCFENAVENPEKLAVKISDRHFGVGGDGLVLILPSQVADCKMRIFNADGSEAQMCGNAIRCVGKYFYENYVIPKRHTSSVFPQSISRCLQDIVGQARNNLSIETLCGIKTLELFPLQEGNIVSEVKVDMGKADFTAKNVPVLVNSDTYINMPLKIDGEGFNITAVSMGNPHSVIFCKNTEKIDLERIGEKIEHHPLFPERVNVEFVQVVDNNTINMRVWERGSGETLACGTGACASAAAAMKNGLIKPDTEICVKVKGGELFITCRNDYQIFMKGNAVEVFRGNFNSTRTLL